MGRPARKKFRNNRGGSITLSATWPEESNDGGLIKKEKVSPGSERTNNGVRRNVIMRKSLFLAWTLAVVLVLGASGAWADAVFVNNTLVEAYSAGTPPVVYNGGLNDSKGRLGSTAWWDSIGSTHYESYGAQLLGTTLYLYTNFGGANVTDQAGAKVVVPADLFLNLDPGNNADYDVAIRLRSTSNKIDIGDGTVYYGIQTPKTSVQMMAGAGESLIFGGKYNYGGAKDVPVEVNQYGTTGSTNVKWTYGIYSVNGLALPNSNIWQVEVNLYGITGLNINTFDFLWGTGTCANDTIQGGLTGGVVPLPGALVLLGSGLFRLAAYSRKRRMAG
jgi:hypothetical protein